MADIYDKDAIVHLFLPNLVANPRPARVTKDSQPAGRIYFQQGDLDGACGMYSLIMALVLRGSLSRRAARTLIPRMRSQYIGDSSVSELFFSGCNAHDLRSLARSLPQPVRCSVIEGSHTEVLRRVIRRVSAGVPVLLAAESRSQRYSHWVLVVGVEYRGARLKEPTALLGLDPGASCAPPVLRAFNWRLDLEHPRKGARFLRCTSDAGDSVLVTCTEALVVR